MREAAGDGGGRHAMLLTDDGILYIRIMNVWSIAEVDRFFEALAPIHAQARRQHGRVCTLVEVGAVQSPTVAIHVRKHALAIKRPGDRTAMLVATILSKLQIKRLATNEGFGLFTDRATARTWLTTDEQ